jgi:hypothetical protein
MYWPSCHGKGISSVVEGFSLLRPFLVTATATTAAPVSSVWRRCVIGVWEVDSRRRGDGVGSPSPFQLQRGLDSRILRCDRDAKLVMSELKIVIK